MTDCRTITIGAMALFAANALAQGLAPQPPPPAARQAYRQQMAAEEVERLAAQFSLLNENVDAIAGRLSKLENRPSADKELREEIAVLRASIAEIKNRQNAMRKEIVDEISAKVAKLIKEQQPAPPPPPAAKPKPQPKPKPEKPQPPAGNYYEYTIEQGQTIYDVAVAYGTTVKKILDANPGINPKALRIGQKIMIPAE